MRKIYIVVILLVAQVGLVSAVVKRSGFNVTDPNSPQPVYVSVTNCSELAGVTGSTLGDAGFCLDTNKYYRWDGSVWQLVLDDTSANVASTGYPRLDSSGHVGTAQLGSGTANSSTFLRGDGTYATPSAGGLPSGLIVMTLTSCPSGFTEVSSLSGKFVLGTVAANGDVGTTGGADNITPAGTNNAPTFTGNSFSSVINHTHAVNITDPTHNHTQNSFAPRIVNSGTAGTVGVQGASTASNANASNAATTATNQAASTGITATTNNPAGGVSSITPTGSVTAPTFTGTSFDNRPAFIRVIFCSAN